MHVLIYLAMMDFSFFLILIFFSSPGKILKTCILAMSIQFTDDNSVFYIVWYKYLQTTTWWEDDFELEVSSAWRSWKRV